MEFRSGTEGAWWAAQLYLFQLDCVWMGQFSAQLKRAGNLAKFTAIFLFFYFLFSFFTKIYFRFRNLQEYTPAAPLQGGRDLVAPLRGGRVFSAKISRKFLQKSPWRTGRPAAGRPAPQGRRAPAARQQGDRLPCPYIRVGWSPHSSFALLKFQKRRKKREGGREAKPY